MHYRSFVYSIYLKIALAFDPRFDNFCRNINNICDNNIYSKADIKEKAYIVELSGYEKLVRLIISLKIIKMDKVQDSMSKIKIKIISDNQNLLSRNDRSFKSSCLIILNEWKTCVKEREK